jgi:hypothetical protein
MPPLAPQVSKAEQPPANRFKAEMPIIPGVNDRAVKSFTFALRPRIVALVLAAVGILAGLGASMYYKDRYKLGSPDTSSASPRLQTESASPLRVLSTTPKRGPVIAATIEELSTTWAAKNFTFSDPVTHAAVSAMVVRLPGAGNRSDSFWAFSTKVPYESCELEYVTNLSTLASVYMYTARHPMLVAPCNNTVYDPMRIGTAPTGAWVRGEVVRGSGIRPPTSIEVQVQGHSIIARRME